MEFLIVRQKTSFKQLLSQETKKNFQNSRKILKKQGKFTKLQERCLNLSKNYKNSRKLLKNLNFSRQKLVKVASERKRLKQADQQNPSKIVIDSHPTAHRSDANVFVQFVFLFHFHAVRTF